MDKIICIGKNYDAHIKEIADPHTDTPVIFLKPPSVLQSIKNHGIGKLKLPSGFGKVHYEAELVLRINKKCYQVSASDAHHYFDAVSIGLDLTLRDLQSKLKKQSQPWTISKVFPDSAVCGEWRLIKEFKNYEEKEFFFSLNNNLRQIGTAKDMIWSCAQCVSHSSRFFELLPGDIIFTGTPSGVGSVQASDTGQLRYHDINFNVEWIS